MNRIVKVEGHETIHEIDQDAYSKSVNDFLKYINSTDLSNCLMVSVLQTTIAIICAQEAKNGNYHLDVNNDKELDDHFEEVKKEFKEMVNYYVFDFEGKLE